MDWFYLYRGGLDEYRSRKCTYTIKKLTDLYLAIFDKNSLDRVIYMDPLYCYELSEIEKGIDALATAIENNKPIKQIQKNIWSIDILSF